MKKFMFRLTAAIVLAITMGTQAEAASSTFSMDSGGGGGGTWGPVIWTSRPVAGMTRVHTRNPLSQHRATARIGTQTWYGNWRLSGQESTVTVSGTTNVIAGMQTR